MRPILLILAGLLCFGCTANAQKQTADNAEPSGKRILVACFSCTGTTEKAASAIAGALGCRLYRITPAVVYTPGDLDWRNPQSRSSVEMAEEDSRPELAGENLRTDDYDILLLGYPIWWNQCPRAVNTFLEKYDFSGKTVIPFATSGGSPITHSVGLLKALYPKIVWKEGKLLNGGAAQAREWAEQAVE